MKHEHSSWAVFLTNWVHILFLARGGPMRGTSESLATGFIRACWLKTAACCGWNDTDETRTRKFVGHKTNINSPELETITQSTPVMLHTLIWFIIKTEALKERLQKRSNKRLYKIIFTCLLGLHVDTTVAEDQSILHLSIINRLWL